MDAETDTRRTARLPDGRRLGYHEFGAPDGIPCVYLPGWPASGLLGAVYDEAARTAGVRWISVDKPGIGGSDPCPGRSLRDYPADIAALADQLGVDRFVVIGESGGGPHALSVTHGIPERLAATILVSAMGPAHEKSVREGMRTMNRRLITLAQRAPWLLRLQLKKMGRTLDDQAKAKRWGESMAKGASESDLRAMAKVDPAVLMGATREALHDNGRPATEEMLMIARPWGFALSDIAAPVAVWHGTEDRNVPVVLARKIVEDLPNAELRLFDGEGHSVGVLIQEELMGTVIAASA